MESATLWRPHFYDEKILLNQSATLINRLPFLLRLSNHIYLGERLSLAGHHVLKEIDDRFDHIEAGRAADGGVLAAVTEKQPDWINKPQTAV